jgi:hypothetical protein
MYIKVFESVILNVVVFLQPFTLWLNINIPTQ